MPAHTSPSSGLAVPTTSSRRPRPSMSARYRSRRKTNCPTGNGYTLSGIITPDRKRLRDAGGPVTRVSLGPKWLFPPVVVATSPQAARDILGRRDRAVRRVIG
jgi:hypothetical protein